MTLCRRIMFESLALRRLVKSVLLPQIIWNLITL